MPACAAVEETPLALFAAFFATVAAIVYAGLAPFEFDPENRVGWLEDRPGLSIEGASLVYSEREIELAAADGSLSVELWFRPTEQPTTRLARILAFHDDGPVPVLSIDQWKGALILRDRLREPSSGSGYRELRALRPIREGEQHFFALSSGPSGAVAYLNGRPGGVSSSASLMAPDERFRARLLLGNSDRGNQRWLGELYGVSIYNRVLSEAEIAEHAERVAKAGVASLRNEAGLEALYAFHEGQGLRAQNLVPDGPDLEIPAEFHPLRTTFLTPPRLSDRRYGWYRYDLALNIVGFAPLGFLLAALLARQHGSSPRTRLIAITLLGLGLSLGIELTQAYLPGRVSSTTDLISNGLGAGMGAALYQLWARRRSADAERTS